MRERVDQGKIPGYCSVVIRNGKLLHSDAYGLADPNTGLKYGPDVIMRMFCMTKIVVATAILHLHDQGKLSVNDAVEKYIPSMKRMRVVTSPNVVFSSRKAKKKLTILHLLTHTGGIGYGPGWNFKPSSPEEKRYVDLCNSVEGGDVKNLRAFIERFSTLPLCSEPGTNFHYSYSFDVLGRVIEVVSGKSLGKYLHQSIFKPLKMKDTGFTFPTSKARRVAALFASPATAASLGADKTHLPRSKQALCRIDGTKASESRWCEKNPCPVEAGGGFQGHNMGGLVSTLNDFAKFLSMLMNGGIANASRGTRIVSPSTLQRYGFKDLLPRICAKAQRCDHRGFFLPLGYSALGEVGLKRSGRHAKKKSHMYDFDVDEIGSGGAACTYYSLDPRRKTVILWFTQSLDNEAYTKQEQSLWCIARKVLPVDARYDVSSQPKRKFSTSAQMASRKKIRK